MLFVCDCDEGIAEQVQSGLLRFYRIEESVSCGGTVWIEAVQRAFGICSEATVAGNGHGMLDSPIIIVLLQGVNTAAHRINQAFSPVDQQFGHLQVERDGEGTCDSNGIRRSAALRRW